MVALLLSGFLFFRIVARGNKLPRLERRMIFFFFLHPMVFLHAHLHAGDDRDGVLRALGAAHNAQSRISMGNRGRRNGLARGG